MFEAVCPACGEDIKFDEDLEIGQNTVCPKCQELLVVVTTDPLIFDLYTFANTAPQWFDSEKQEAAKKHERKNKHRHIEIDNYDEDYLRKSGKKIRNKNRIDW
jgi:nicotinamide mononucleotide adenylyltransferase